MAQHIILMNRNRTGEKGLDREHMK